MKLVDKITSLSKTSILNVFFSLGLILAIYGFIQEKFGVFVCTTDGCAVVKTIVKIDSILLYVAASIFFVALLLINNIEKLSIFKKHLDLLFFSGLVFETIMFFNALFVHDAFCKECAKMVSLLFIIGFIIDYKKMIFPLAVVSAIFLLNPIVESTPLTEQRTIISKKDCPHCEKAKKFLKENNISFSEVNYKNASSILEAFNINTVPILIIKNDTEIKIIKGDVNIINSVKEVPEKNIEEENIFSIGNTSKNSSQNNDLLFDIKGVTGEAEECGDNLSGVCKID
jgi:glutaredoxin